VNKYILRSHCDLGVVRVGQVTKKREVEMCLVRRFSSFGELSVLFQQPMTYTVVTSDAVELAVIEPASLEGRY